MKILKDCWAQICAPENIWLAWLRYRKGKRTYPAAREFEYRLEENLLSLALELQAGTYRHGGYTQFLVHDPKQRVISAPSVRDHIAHQAVYNVLYPFFDKIFLPFSFSCRKSKGTHKAVALMQKYARQVSGNYRRDCWVLHGDVKKCFDSIDHAILLHLLGRKIECPQTMLLLKEIIASYRIAAGNNASPHGIPLGNLTSQLFINVYLHELDCWVKNKLTVKKYIRYADDFLLIFRSRAECEYFTCLIRKFLREEIKLDFPPTHEKIVRLSRGVETLGRKFLPFYNAVGAKTYKRSLHQFRQKCQDYASQKIGANTLNASWQSLVGMLRYGHNANKTDNLLNLVNAYARTPPWQA